MINRLFRGHGRAHYRTTHLRRANRGRRHIAVAGTADPQVHYADAADVMLYTVDGGGHPWPAGPSFVASEYILDFFDEHAA